MINLQLHNDSGLYIQEDAAKKVVSIVLSEHGHPKANISVVLIDDDSLREMKKKYFGEDLYTDIISFNLEEDPFEGELYISYDRVKSNAIELNEKYDVELKRVIIHGLLHLCGYDDSTKEEKIKMTELEDNYLNKTQNYRLAN